MNKPIFGYHKQNIDAGSSAINVVLYSDGKLIVCARDGRNDIWRDTAMQVSHACVHEIWRILIANAMALRRYAEEINGTEKNFENENYFIFGDQKIIDWDITRWYLEEDRKKHPEYYRNSVRVELTENYVRGIFDEICEVIEQDNKKVQYFKMFYRG